jgi:hypothetical protein
MDFRKVKWPLAAAGAALIFVIVSLLSNGRRPAPAPNMTEHTSVPHMPSAADVAGLDAVVDGSEPLSPFADRFKVPQDYINEVCAYFSNRNIEPWMPSDKLSIQWNKYGELYFVLKDGSRLDVSFYVVGKGGTGFSIGDGFYQADCANDDDGALSIWHVLERARRAIGAPAAVPRPPRPKDIIRLVGEIHRNNLGVPVVGQFKVQEQFYDEICACLAGEVSRWPLETEERQNMHAIGELGFIRKDGGRLTPFGIRIYSTGEGWTGFRYGDDYYRARFKGGDGGIALLRILERASHAAEKLD